MTAAVLGIAGCLSADGEAVFPDADFPRLRDALAAAGVDAVLAAWDDETYDWSVHDLVVLRSTWTSVDRPEAYLRWIEAVAATTPVENSPAVVRWNLDKRHLDDLRRADLPTVETTWVEPGRAWVAPAMPFVVKPAISAGGRKTALYAHDPTPAAGHVARIHAAGRAAMVQPYVSSVDERGETKMVFIGGHFSHAVRVGPLLEPDAGVLTAPWEKPVPVEPMEPTAAELEVAHAVMRYVTDRLGPCLYGRVDTAIDGDGRPALLELELVDPSLSLWASDGAAERLAAAIVERLA